MMDRIGLHDGCERRRRAKLRRGLYVALGLVSWSCSDSADTSSQPSSEAGRGSTYLRVDAGAPMRPEAPRDAGAAGAPAAGAAARAAAVAPAGMTAGAAGAPVAGAPVGGRPSR